MPATVDGVIERLRDIDAELPRGDGVAVFNRMYLTVTERIAAALADPLVDLFEHPETMAHLDVAFAGLWLRAYDASVAGRRIPSAWKPLFEARAGGRLPVQYAIAGMNAHIEHDLALAVVSTCESRRLEPDELHRDFEAVNLVLAAVEADVRRSFLDELGRRLDDRVGPVVHLLSAWQIDKARDLSWVTVETLWAIRRLDHLTDRFLSALGHTVGMTSRTLLTPTQLT
jgi:hypothetical protein